MTCIYIYNSYVLKNYNSVTFFTRFSVNVYFVSIVRNFNDNYNYKRITTTGVLQKCNIDTHAMHLQLYNKITVILNITVKKKR